MMTLLFGGMMLFRSQRETGMYFQNVWIKLLGFLTLFLIRVLYQRIHIVSLLVSCMNVFHLLIFNDCTDA